MGGTAAAQYIFALPEQIAGLAIWSSYPADGADLSSLTIPVILMYGGNETGVTDESVSARKRLLPRIRCTSKSKVATIINSVPIY
jgi:hypothetical protein